MNTKLAEKVEVKLASLQDAPVIHDVMIRAFAEYRTLAVSSTALDETVESVIADMEGGEEAMIAYVKGEPAAAVRFEMQDDALYFFRLSVVPEHQGQGLAKKMLKQLETFAKEQGKQRIWCKVRMNMEKNMYLYQAAGYRQYNQSIFHLDGTDLDVAWMEKSVKE